MSPLSHAMIEQITRVLVPFQTLKEYEIRLIGLEDPIWLRTCYDLDLDDAYLDLADNAELGEGYSITSSAAVLDNSSLYNFGSDWIKILTRIPRLCDFVSGLASEDYDRSEEHEAGDSEISELDRTSRRVCTVVYVVDEDAIKDRLVKIMWLCSHGHCAWNNKVKPEGTAALRGGLSGGGLSLRHGSWEWRGCRLSNEGNRTGKIGW